MFKELKTRFTNEVFKGEKSFFAALEKAYADMSRRATGHNSQMKTDALTWIIDNEIFKRALDCKCQDDFDAWHKETCIKLKEIHKGFGRIGRAQKVINMAFKYLSCVDNTYNHILPFCHMALDGYTLNWYKDIGGQWVEWSKIDNYDEYFKIQMKIRNHLKNNNKYCITIGDKTTKNFKISNIPFEAEFVIWEGEIIKAKYNAIIKELNNYKTKGKKKDSWLIDDLFDSYLQTY